jgi:hypothetical protein
MTSPVWRTADRVGFLFLRNARLQAHYAAQWLARAARSYVPERPDESHTNLGWDDAFGGLVTHPLRNGSRIGLKIADLALVVLGKTEQTLSLDGRADAEVRAWLGDQLATGGLDAKKLDAPLSYDMPFHALQYGARYSTEELTGPLATLSAWYANANAALGHAQHKLAARKLKAPAVRCWPHHFDLDCLVPLGGERTVGLGFSPGDEYCDEPYFYITMYPEPSIPALPLLPALGHWHTYEFLAAFAPAHKIVAAPDQGVYVERFIDVSLDAAINALR